MAAILSGGGDELMESYFTLKSTVLINVHYLNAYSVFSH